MSLQSGLSEKLFGYLGFPDRPRCISIARFRVRFPSAFHETKDKGLLAKESTARGWGLGRSSSVEGV